MKNNKYLVMIGIGFELGALVVSFSWIGHIVDQTMKWPGYALAGMSVVALVSWLIHVVFLFNRISANDKED